MVILADNKQGFKRLNVEPEYEESVQDAMQRSEFAQDAPRLVEYASGKRIKVITIVYIVKD